MVGQPFQAWLLAPILFMLSLIMTAAVAAYIGRCLANFRHPCEKTDERLDPAR